MNKRQRMSWVVLATILVSALVISGCGGDGNEDRQDFSPPPGGGTPPIIPDPPEDGGTPDPPEEQVGLPFSTQPLGEIAGNIFVQLSYWGIELDQDEDQIYLLNTSSASQSDSDIFARAAWLSPFSLSPNGRFMAYQEQGADMQVVDLVDNSVIGTTAYKPRGGDRANWHGSDTMVWGTYFEGIFSFDTATGQTTKLMDSWSATYDHNVDVSPDGEKIAWVHHAYEHFVTVYVCDLDDVSYSAATQAWSGRSYYYDEELHLRFLDNDRFVFVINEEEGDSSVCSIYVYSIAAGTVEKVYSTNFIKDPRLSNSKSQISFIGYAESSYRHSLYVADTQSWEVVQLDELKEWIEMAVWSPDDSQIILAIKHHASYDEDAENVFKLLLYQLPDPQVKWLITELPAQQENAYITFRGMEWGQKPN